MRDAYEERLQTLKDDLAAAATALLVTRADVVPATVEAMLRLLFERREGTATAAVAQVAVTRALEDSEVKRTTVWEFTG